MKFEIVCAANNVEVLYTNLLASPNIGDHHITIQVGYTNLCKAYNEAIPKARGEYIIFVHQDVFLHDGFFKQLEDAIKKVGDFGVMGVAGRHGEEYVGHLMDRGIEWGSVSGLPIEVESLDELMLVTKNPPLAFDERIPHYHLFGTDLCCQYRDWGMKNYAVVADCSHNSSTPRAIPDSYWFSYQYMRGKWGKYLPIHTTNATIE
jgi:glycosyltransferase involved in cell wall biosynthesis